MSKTTDRFHLLELANSRLDEKVGFWGVVLLGALNLPRWLQSAPEFWQNVALTLDGFLALVALLAPLIYVIAFVVGFRRAWPRKIDG